MQRAVAKRLFAHHAHRQKPILSDFAVLPRVRICAVEKDERPGGRLGPDCWRFALRLFESVSVLTFLPDDSAILQHGIPLRVFEDHFAVLQFSGDLGFALHIFRTAGQATVPADDAEFPIAERDDLGAAALARVFALDGVVCAGCGWGGE